MDGGREGGQRDRKSERQRESRESRYIESEGERREGREGTESSESRENRERGRKREGDDITLNLDVKLFQYQLIRLWFYVNVALNIDFSGYSVTCVSLYLRPETPLCSVPVFRDPRILRPPYFGTPLF